MVPPAIATLSFLRRRHAICRRERPSIAVTSSRDSVGNSDLPTTSSSPPENDTGESLLHGQRVHLWCTATTCLREPQGLPAASAFHHFRHESREVKMPSPSVAF